jgi:hypothetical protein
MSKGKQQQIFGWTAVAISTIVTCFWAFWGIVENFHEGWYYQSWMSNLGLMITQYLSPMLLFLTVTLIAIYWPRIGSLLHLFLALVAGWFFEAAANPVLFILIAPLVGLGALYWFGRPQPRRIAAFLAAGLPLLVLVISGIEPVLRVSQRLDDGNLQAKLVIGNGVSLVWAPEGPGWPRSGANWYEAQQVCDQLGEEGLNRESGPQGNWRLPTVEELVRSMTRNNKNSGGAWDAVSSTATYTTRPDKESPLWNIHSQVIYWWTATEIDDEHAYIIVYDGKVWPRSKLLSQAYLGFRCVKDP